MKVIKTTYKLTDEEVKDHPFIFTDDTDEKNFYGYIMGKLGLEGLDCRKICIANNIQESWFKYLTNHGLDLASINMMLLMSGPKVDAALNDNEIYIEE